MSNAYTWVQWNRHKKVYDLVLAMGIVTYLLAFIGVSSLVWSGEHAVSPMTLLIRATGTCAIVMLHLILAIGPLARLWPSGFAPLLYNRRHMGVSMFAIALIHSVLVLVWYGAFGVVNPLSAMLTMNTRYASLVGFPFEAFGIAALLILFFMAATSHDFWLKNLSPRWWKAMHMGVYVAYALLVLHVALGAIQGERSLAYPVLIGLGAVALMTMHLITGIQEVMRDARVNAVRSVADGWVDVASVEEIPFDRAKVFTPKKGCAKVAVFRHGDSLSAVANVCAHQGGPLGEGKVIDGCITCPWHGYQYLPHNGQSPPPYTEKIPTYELRIEGKRVLLNPQPLAPGTPVTPVKIARGNDG
ncbi:MAG: ferric reductase-like transmembrane domain-containing protein [Phycisphaerales bacterium JB063]